MKIITIFALFFSILGCQTLPLDKRAEGIRVTRTENDKCIKIGSKKLRSPPVSVIDRGRADQNLLIRAKNEAVDLEATEILIIDDKPKNIIDESKLDVVFVSCKPIEEISTVGLENSCELDQADSCYNVALRAQTSNEYSKMLDYYKRACALQNVQSCNWLSKYEQKKAEFKKSCMKEAGDACYAAAKVADLESDFTLMITFLKQGCSYDDSESCFQQNYVLEQREQAKESENLRYRQYMIALQRESVRQQQIMNTLAILNQRPSSISCTSNRTASGQVFTNCR